VEPIEYLRAIKRRWPVVVVAVGLAVAVAWVTTTVVPLGVTTTEYQATTILMDAGTPTGGVTGVGSNPSLNTVAALTTIKPVAERVAETIGYPGNPEELIPRVRAAADPEAGVIRITARSTDRREAVLLSNAFTDALLGFLADRKAETIQREQAYVEEQLDELSAEIEALAALIDDASEDDAALLEQQRNAKLATFGALTQQNQALAAAAAERGNLQIIQDATARAVRYQGFQAPQSRTARMVIAGILGLLAGAGIALVLERIDTRIRSKRDAERYFGSPVISEIPPISRKAKAPPITAAEPRSPHAEAFRLLGESLVGADGGPSHGSNGEAGRAIMVTSPGPGEGKTTVVANLAAALAEVGNRVLVLSCDFRHPGIHEIYPMENRAGLAEALQSSNGAAVLDGAVRETAIRRVRVVPSGDPPERPSGLLSSPRMERALGEARRLADVVLIDTPPLLTASDAAHLVHDVDGVLLVSRAGRTTAEHAQRAKDLLARLDAPLMGVALNGSTDLRLPGGRSGWTARS
jgi:capsular exopolysaccharide synthesis family protein